LSLLSEYEIPQSGHSYVGLIVFLAEGADWGGGQDCQTPLCP